MWADWDIESVDIVTKGCSWNEGQQMKDKREDRNTMATPIAADQIDGTFKSDSIGMPDNPFHQSNPNNTFCRSGQ